MTIGCKGRCPQYSVKEIGRKPRYADGVKWCKNCNVYMRWEGVRCPCCALILRCKPRAKKLKQEYYARQEEVLPRY